MAQKSGLKALSVGNSVSLTVRYDDRAEPAPSRPEPEGARSLDHVSCQALDVISFGDSAVADEGAGDAREGEEVFGFAFV
ncbi:hypothetical protein ABZY81_40495, partial [Streptomyces sp. NPDC006514]|uniref:hypothetical protein n=1 Tax=Streptomyces sp. NPDC006514 TaxID=3154308 RepID=UPI0033B13117